VIGAENLCIVKAIRVVYRRYHILFLCDRGSRYRSSGYGFVEFFSVRGQPLRHWVLELVFNSKFDSFHNSLRLWL